MKKEKKFYKKLWFWLICVVLIGGIINEIIRNKEIKSYKYLMNSIDLSDTSKALYVLDSLYKSKERYGNDTDFGPLRDSVKQLMISLGKDPDYIPKKQVSPKIVTKEEKMLDALSKWDGSLPPLVEVVKEAMNDPDSYKHEKTTYIQTKVDSTDFLITMIYRGKNAFGGVVKNTVKCVYNVDSKSIRDIRSFQ